MARKIVLILAATALPSLLIVAAESGVANAASNPTNLPGNVTCSPAGGVWSGAITFTPPLLNGGTSSTEVFTVQATLGNSASFCVAPSVTVPVLGTIVGKLKFSIPGNANNCATIFSGVTLPAPAAGSKFKMTWTTPAGSNPTKWTQPTAFKVTGAANSSGIAIKHGTVAGSFTPFAAPKATLSDATWPGLAGAVATGCASAGGLASLTLSTSSGKW
jgi:hypothetical protein